MAPKKESYSKTPAKGASSSSSKKPEKRPSSSSKMSEKGSSSKRPKKERESSSSERSEKELSSRSPKRSEKGTVSRSSKLREDDSSDSSSKRPRKELPSSCTSKQPQQEYSSYPSELLNQARPSPSSSTRTNPGSSPSSNTMRTDPGPSPSSDMPDRPSPSTASKRAETEFFRGPSNHASSKMPEQASRSTYSNSRSDEASREQIEDVYEYESHRARAREELIIKGQWRGNDITWEDTYSLPPRNLPIMALGDNWEGRRVMWFYQLDATCERGFRVDRVETGTMDPDRKCILFGVAPKPPPPPRPPPSIHFENVVPGGWPTCSPEELFGEEPPPTRRQRASAARPQADVRQYSGDERQLHPPADQPPTGRPRRPLGHRLNIYGKWIDDDHVTPFDLAAGVVVPSEEGDRKEFDLPYRRKWDKE